MTSYLKYKRDVAVLDADDTDVESWITVRGNHIPIKKGQSKEEAVQSFVESKLNKGDWKLKDSKTGEIYKTGKSGHLEKESKYDPDFEVVRKNALANGNVYGGKYTQKSKAEAYKEYKNDTSSKENMKKANEFVNGNPESSKIRTVAEVEKSVNEAFADYSLEVEKMWKKAKNKMDYHGIGYGSIETIIESGKYAPEDIIEALESNYHDKIDEMRKDAEKSKKESKTESKGDPRPKNADWETVNDVLFSKYVPKQGKADTLLGEQLRAINKIVYRYENDGDMYGNGYGVETVNAPVKFLQSLYEEKSIPGLSGILSSLKNAAKTNDTTEYEYNIQRLKNVMVNADWETLKKLANTKNDEDMYSFEDDTKYDDDEEEW